MAELYDQLMPKLKTVLVISILILALSTCSNPSTSLPTAVSTSTTSLIIKQPVIVSPQQPTTASGQFTPLPTQGNSIPQTEAGVPRVSVEDAKAAFDSGEAIIVDVRSQQAYDSGHIKGAILIQLGDILTNPLGLNLDPMQWIITYCT